jgi:predicted TIM-barrel fold metal-dependent hydrolase
MFRRKFLKVLGMGSAGAVFTAARQTQAAESAASPSDVEVNTKVGDLDLMHIDAIDSHVHPLSRDTISFSYARQARGFTDVMMPPGDYPGRQELDAKMHQGFTDLVNSQPRRTGYFNYIARTYGVPATNAGFDSVVSKHIGSDADFTQYITTVLDREKIPALVLQSREPDPVPPTSHIPASRYVWTWPFLNMTRPDWAKENGLSTLQDVADAIDKQLETAASNGCRGFKTNAAYWRPFTLTKVSAREADSALKALLKATPTRVDERNRPHFGDTAMQAHLRTYEDYIFKHVYVKAGEIQIPIIIHTAVALHPRLRADLNTPVPLYDVFTDDDVQRADTRFVLIHSGYPSHHIVASMISQLPNVYTDVSFFAKYPGTLEEVYRAFLSLGPSEKVMHGSDANTIPEEIAYCAWNSRSVLARVLNDHKKHYGWTQPDVEKMANNVLHANARRIFRIPG